MIKSLSIKNIALIDYANIEFSNGLNVLSGETGSGKSVIVDCLNFILGAKADKTLIQHGKDFMQVIAEFSIENNKKIKELLEEYLIEFEGELIVTRRLTLDMKSKIKINGESVTLTMLKNIANNLVDIHGQSEHYSLLKNANQLEIVDKFAGNSLKNEMFSLKNCIDKLRQLDSQISSFGGDEQERSSRIDYLNFTVSEIEKAELIGGELEQLQSRKKMLLNMQKLIDNYQIVTSNFSNENGITDLLNGTISCLSRLSGIDEECLSLIDRLENISAEIGDIESIASDKLYSLSLEENDIDLIEERLDLIKKLQRKYGNTIEIILEYAENSKNEIVKLMSFDEEIERLAKEKSISTKELFKIYQKISNVRMAESKNLSKLIENELHELAMPSGKFEVNFENVDMNQLTSYKSNGIDKINFMFSANLGQPLKDMSKVISGGEMSRFMLALKVVTSCYLDISTYIFDEIDAGISGAVGKVMAEKFAKIAKTTQIIAISHLPQIVAMSDRAFKISKIEHDNRTIGEIAMLSEDQKVNEIIRLIGGKQDSVIASKHSVELIRESNEFKKQIKI